MPRKASEADAVAGCLALLIGGSFYLSIFSLAVLGCIWFYRHM